MEDLRAGRFVVRIVQTHQGVSDKRGELAPGNFKLRMSGWRLQHFCQVSSNLEFCVPAAVDCRGPFDLFIPGENLLWHLESVEIFGERHQSTADGRAVLHLPHSIAEGE